MPLKCRYQKTRNDPLPQIRRPHHHNRHGRGRQETLLTHWITSGPRVAEFEAALSAYHGGVPRGSSPSATAAMEVAFQVIGVQPGDEIITRP